ncbi:MAG TPA: M24 family metallopeptidase [Candidatus Sulfomarinibacteraceae bacterium]|nr:M24 family metallopeptidase [Candidatus Sulfomarinibacteraceae bacterium]
MDATSAPTTNVKRLRHLLQKLDLDAALLRSAASFAWATEGAASYINIAATEGEASLLVTPDDAFLLTNNIEAPRLEREECLHEQGWTFKVAPWHRQNDLLTRLTRGLTVGADLPTPGAADLQTPLSRLRAQLTPLERERFRELGRLCAGAMDEAARAVRPGMTEQEIAARLAAAAQKRGALPTVLLIASDERIFHFRHPLPTEKKLQRYAMLILCGRRHGLVCSLTRFVHFGPLPQELAQKARAVAAVDAAFIRATRPGRRAGDVFQAGVAAYAAQGYAGEWQKHHQGGPAGYEPREYLVTPDTDDEITAGQVYAWNPSITGTKSEDTILVGGEGAEILTRIDGWPGLEVGADDGQTIFRPAILKRD